jgi:uncharacterized protein YoxC
MMSFLKSSRSNEAQRIERLEKKLEEAYSRIKALEEDNAETAKAIQALSTCVTTVAISVRDLAQEYKSLAEVISIAVLKKKNNSQWKKNEDDDLIN